MQAYGESFAPIYDLRWGGFARYVGPRILEFYNRIGGAEHPNREASSVLDLFCGAGHLSEVFLADGFSVLGLDLSPAMIERARDRNRAYVEHGLARFEVADARSFRTAERYGLVCATFDAVNHLDDVEELRACFRSVRGSLLEGGYFIFDINTEKGLHHWNGLEVDESPEMTIISRGVFGPGMTRAYTHVTGFRKTSDTCYTRFEETVYNTVFSVAEVLESLAAAGFGDVRVTHDADFTRDLTDPERWDRVFFVARP